MGPLGDLTKLMTGSGRARTKPGGEGTIIRALVVPRASKSEVVGWFDGALKIRIAAPPVDGAANKELKETLAKLLGVSKSSVSITGGRNTKRKTILIKGLEPYEVLKAFDG